MTLQQLEYVVALDEHRHYVSAAEHCFVSQPNLTMQIKRLRKNWESGYLTGTRSRCNLQKSEKKSSFARVRS